MNNEESFHFAINEVTALMDSWGSEDLDQGSALLGALSIITANVRYVAPSEDAYFDMVNEAEGIALRTLETLKKSPLIDETQTGEWNV